MVSVKLTSEQKRELERLVAAGDKIEAIKQLRNMADVGLAEAKAFIESLERGGHSSSAHEGTPRNARAAEEAALAALRGGGNLIQAMKDYRIRTGVSLREAKDTIDALSLTQRTGGRVSPSVAKSVIALVIAGEREQALTQLMSQAGYDDTEARDILKTLGALRLGGAAVGGGCVRMVIGAVILIAIALVIIGNLASR